MTPFFCVCVGSCYPGRVAMLSTAWGKALAQTNVSWVEQSQPVRHTHLLSVHFFFFVLLSWTNLSHLPGECNVWGNQMWHPWNSCLVAICTPHIRRLTLINKDWCQHSLQSTFFPLDNTMSVGFGNWTLISPTHPEMDAIKLTALFV